MDGKLGSKGRLAAVLESMPTVNDGDWKGELTASPSEPFISLIMCCKSPKGFGERYKRTSEDLDFVPMIGMNSMAEGYNLGAKKAKADILVFTHDDVEIQWDKSKWEKLINQLKLENSGIAGVVGYRQIDGRHWLPIQFGSGACMHSEGTEEWLSTFGDFGETIILDGIFLAMTRKVFDDIGGFDEDYPGWHFYDIDISFRAHMKGYKNFTFPLKIKHDKTRTKKVNPEEWKQNERIFMEKWGDKLPKTLKYTTEVTAKLVDSVIEAKLPEEKLQRDEETATLYAPQTITAEEEKIPVATEKPEDKQFSVLTGADFNRVLAEFHWIYYHGHGLVMGTQNIGNPMGSAKWMGLTIQKCPLDMWVYQEILFETRPDLIIEAGTGNGASALYLAHICDMLGSGQVVTIDIKGIHYRRPHPRVTYLVADICHEETLAAVKQIIGSFTNQPRIMMIFDDDHGQKHVEQELEMWWHLVSPGCYMVVEDTNVNGNPVFPNHGPGPKEAVETFMEKHDEEFFVDYGRQKFLMTCHPGGFLRRL